MIKGISDIQRQLENKTKRFRVRCGICKEELGDYRPSFARDHLLRYPEHKIYEILKKY